MLGRQQSPHLLPHQGAGGRRAKGHLLLPQHSLQLLLLAPRLPHPQGASGPARGSRAQGSRVVGRWMLWLSWIQLRMLHWQL